MVVRLQTERDLAHLDRRPSTCLSQIIDRAHVQMQKRACLSSKCRVCCSLIGRGNKGANMRRYEIRERLGRRVNE